MTQPKLYNRGKKLWVRFSLNGEVIKRPLKLENTKANRKLANTQVIPQMILRIHSEEFFENETIKVPMMDEFSKVSFEIHKKYLRSYEIHIQPYFGQRRLDKIKASDIAKW